MTEESVFERARKAADIAKVAGVDLYKAGKRMRGQCPLCGSGKGKKSGGPFSVDTREKAFKCWSCNEAGDVIRLESLITGSPPIECAQRLAGEPGHDPQPRRVEVKIVTPDADEPTFAERFAEQIWAESVPARNTLVQRYLRSRGMSGWVLLTMVEHLRFHPNVYHSRHEGRSLAFPGMVGQVVVPGDMPTLIFPTGGIHVTYMARDGSGKAPLGKDQKAKKMWGRQGLNGIPGGVWLSNIDGPGDLLVAEGIETVGSMAMLHAAPARMVAALSLDRLQGGWVSDRYGRFDPDRPQAHPERPAFTWPEPANAPWGRVFIGVDMDMSPSVVKVRGALRGGTIKRTLDFRERARLCGALAAQHWRRGGASDVRPVAPGPGEDFNDKLLRLIAAGEFGA